MIRCHVRSDNITWNEVICLQVQSTSLKLDPLHKCLLTVLHDISVSTQIKQRLTIYFFKGFCSQNGLYNKLPGKITILETWFAWIACTSRGRKVLSVTHVLSWITVSIEKNLNQLIMINALKSYIGDSSPVRKRFQQTTYVIFYTWYTKPLLVSIVRDHDSKFIWGQWASPVSRAGPLYLL